MMNYTGWDIPEGKVTEVEDASGRVIWKAAPSVATITLTGNMSSNCFAVYKGTRYTSAGTFEAAIGDTISVACSGAPTGNFIYLNGTQVANGQGSATYEYKVVGNATIEATQTGQAGLGYMDVKYRMYITDK